MPSGIAQPNRPSYLPASGRPDRDSGQQRDDDPRQPFEIVARIHRHAVACRPSPRQSEIKDHDLLIGGENHGIKPQPPMRQSGAMGVREAIGNPMTNR